jgi:hypothetical protein
LLQALVNLREPEMVPSQHMALEGGRGQVVIRAATGTDPVRGDFPLRWLAAETWRVSCRIVD